MCRVQGCAVQSAVSKVPNALLHRLATSRFHPSSVLNSAPLSPCLSSAQISLHSSHLPPTSTTQKLSRISTVPALVPPGNVGGSESHSLARRSLSNISAAYLLMPHLTLHLHTPCPAMSAVQAGICKSH